VLKNICFWGGPKAANGLLRIKDLGNVGQLGFSEGIESPMRPLIFDTEEPLKIILTSWAF
jgi:hypothetical protein